MTLLLEQKQELDDLREKGIELETATATTAAAAIATAQKAKEHEKRSTAMFSQTEELMKVCTQKTAQHFTTATTTLT